MATLKKSLKLHKLFVSELDRSARLEKEGAQVLSSLANVSRRLPTLLQAADGATDAGEHSTDAEVLGVLRFSRNSHALLLQKHFLALEKSRGFLANIAREYQELLRRLRSFTAESATLVDDALLEDECAAQDAAVAVTLRLVEWMETVTAMLELETRRKTRLLAGLEYSDVEHLGAASRLWSAHSAAGNVDAVYVKSLVQLQTPPASVDNASRRGKKKGKKSAK